MSPGEASPLVARSAYTDEGYRLCGCGYHLRDRGHAIFFTLALLTGLLVAKESCNDALPASIEALRPSSKDAKKDAGTVFSRDLTTYGDFANAAGKGLQIPLNHFFGTRPTILSATTLGAAGMLVFAIGNSTTYTTKSVGWSVAQIGSGMLWGSCGRTFVNWVDFSRRGRLLAVVFGVGADAGGGFATLLYSYLTPLAGGWRYPFIVSSSLFAFVGGLCAGMLRGTAVTGGFRVPFEPDTMALRDPPDPLVNASLFLALRTFLLSLRCLLTIAAAAGYAIAWGGIVSHIPVYAVERLGASSGAATRLVSWGRRAAGRPMLLPPP
jgi:MFS family permease